MESKQSGLSTMDQYIMRVAREKNPETVERLIQLVRQKYSISEREIMKHILRLQNQRKLIFIKHQTQLPSAVQDYILSTRAMWYWIIIALSLATATAVFTIPEEVFPIVYVRYILGSIFILLLPGYSFIKAIFPRKELDNVERFALSLGMSLVLVPVTGLILSYTPLGIRSTPIILSLLTLTVIFATTAMLREHQAQLREGI